MRLMREGIRSAPCPYPHDQSPPNFNFLCPIMGSRQWSIPFILYFSLRATYVKKIKLIGHPQNYHLSLSLFSSNYVHPCFVHPRWGCFIFGLVLMTIPARTFDIHLIGDHAKFQINCKLIKGLIGRFTNGWFKKERC